MDDHLQKRRRPALLGQSLVKLACPSHGILLVTPFFNRAYAAVSRLDDLTLRTTRLDDLVFWGGWKDPESLNIYVRRARGERARLGLAAWGSGEQRWKVLG